MSSPISKLLAMVAKSGVSFDLGMLARVRLDGGTVPERKFIVRRLVDLWNAPTPASLQLARFVDQLRRELEEQDVMLRGQPGAQDGAWLTEQQWQELTQLARQALEEGSR